MRLLNPRSRSQRLGMALLLAALAFELWSKPALVLAEKDTLTLLIQPILGEEQTRQAYQPLTDYLEGVTGRKCVIMTQPNFISYWNTLRKTDSYDLVLDAAHFTDYRAQKYGFKVLAKIPDTVSYSLIVPEDKLIFDPSELVGRTVATLGPPSIGAARLSAMFPNPVRQPTIIEVASSEEGMELVVSGRVHAAILPTPLVSQQMARSGGITVVMTTEPIPHIALSAAPRLNGALRDKIRSAMLEADKTDAGKKMLKGIGFPKFDPATPAVYTGQSRILRDYWGY